MSIQTIAIIGCGAAGTTFFRAFIDECFSQKIKSINIILFEQGRELGPGLAYQDDLEHLITNSPVQNISANPYDRYEFYDWLKRKRIIAEEDTNQTHEPIYTSRKIFGLYLNELFEKTIMKACLVGLTTRVYYDKVIRIMGTQHFIIETISNKSYLADAVILCTGHNQPKDIYQLNHTPRYINNPYPIKEIIPKIGINDTVGILGNSLSAVDIAIGLQKTGFLGKIHMFSRQNIIPRVRGIINNHQLKFLTMPAIKQIIKKDGRISLRGILRLFRKEMQLYHLSWQFLFAEDDKTKSFSEILKNNLLVAEHILPWQSVIPATNNVSEFLWQQLNEDEKNLFFKYYQRTWLNHRTSIPPVNARLILNLADEKRLAMSSGIQNVVYHARKRKYIISLNDNSESQSDWIINATGSANYISPQDGLPYELVKNNLAKEHRLGGLEVDFATAALINKQNQINHRLRLIGQNTIGVYQYTSSLEQIAKKSMQIARNFVTFIKEVVHDKNKKIASAYPDRISHLTQNLS